MLREVLFDKRILKIVVDSDLYGSNEKTHKSTRLKIYFAMKNTDRYCIRLDFPHDGEDSIHLNLNDPGIKRSVGFPLKKEEYWEIYRHSKEKELFVNMFYEMNDRYWFKSDFATKIHNYCHDMEAK